MTSTQLTHHYKSEELAKKHMETCQAEHGLVQSGGWQQKDCPRALLGLGKLHSEEKRREERGSHPPWEGRHAKMPSYFVENRSTPTWSRRC
eukprot:6398119-Amphidinium_carterae.1